MNGSPLAALAALLIAASSGAAEIALDDLSSLEFRNAEGRVTTFEGHPALQVLGPMTRAEDKLVILDAQLGNGTIEVELAGGVQDGAVAAARGFVGVAFHAQEGGEKFEAFYLRPTNGRADDQQRRNHSSQYTSFPDHPWHELREETPGKYEAYVDLVPDTWTSVKITVDGDQARLYVHGNEQPTLIVNDLKLPETSGAVGLWVGPGTRAHFRDLRVTAD